MERSERKLLEQQRRERAALDTSIRSQRPTDEYRDGWDRIWGSKSERARGDAELEARLAAAVAGRPVPAFERAFGPASGKDFGRCALPIEGCIDSFGKDGQVRCGSLEPSGRCLHLRPDASCPSGCRGIDLGDGEHSGCSCSARGEGQACDCPNHPGNEDVGVEAEGSYCRCPADRPCPCGCHDWKATAG